MLKSIPSVLPKPFNLPQPLAGLERLAVNLWWTWNPSAQDLFRRLDPDLWAEGVPPAGILRRTKNLASASADPAFVADVQRVAGEFDRYMAGGPKFEDERVIAYFCAEYGFHESMNLYAGGLGILAGDHCKEASDMNLPFVGIGMFYRRGFFHQMVDWEGRQEHLYPELPPEQHSVTRVVKPGTQEPLTVQIPLPGRTLNIAVWLASVGRIPLLLMDTDLPENAEQDRPITSQLYVNTREMRLTQETVLGVGGVRVLRALGIAPTVWHMNEGHSAFLLLERLREQLADGATVDAARLAIQVDSVITIHTPVPEGNERFSAELADSLIAPVLDGTSLKASAVLEMGLGADGDPGVFDMTAFALRNSRMANGVSLLHGQTADKTWREIAGFPVIGVTNGVHMPTWIGPEMKKVFAAQGAEFGEDTRMELTSGANRPTWEGISNVPDRDLWQAHLAQKRAMIEFAKRRLYVQHARHGEGPDDLRFLLDALNPEAMIIGFARRFATYKRASLLFTDEDRLARMLDAPGRPVQIIFSGKSHPTDRGGQELIKKVYQKTQEPRFRGKVFLLEDYDIEVGRNLVQGADIWLNNPRRPLEASGTSGMKAAANGLPNVSILDGWWDEAFEGGPNFNGWAIGGREEVQNWDEQDRLDAQEAYRILENEVIPLYFDRDATGLPIRWIPVMKRAIATSVYAFSTRRMLEDYLGMML
ncbi:MAG: glycosyltransferase family 1 protein [Armatimonadetes bacterium]|jgi:starch phosphorylase|nr:glycosyltransferase family 1 protein [Armatimonadota bacterium]HOC31250.1 alpha-glucan family phosphorylase [Armatimonadota bacterium]